MKKIEIGTVIKRDTDIVTIHSINCRTEGYIGINKKGTICYMDKSIILPKIKSGRYKILSGNTIRKL